MTLDQLKESLALWQRRVKYRLARWREYRYRTTPEAKGMSAAQRTMQRAKWWALLTQARARVKLRQYQIANYGPEVSDAGVALVAEFEGFRSHPYKDVVGVWTIGYGETRGIGPNTKPWTKEYAKAQLRKRLNNDYLPAVLAANKRLTQNQLDGFTSFVYNVGTGGVAPTTKVGRYLREGKINAAADAILEWNKAGGRVLAGLTRRRNAERALILKK